MSRRMTKLLKTVVLAGSLLVSAAVVSFADAPKTADKAPSAGSASGSGSAAKSTPSKTTKTPAKGSGAGSGSGK